MNQNHIITRIENVKQQYRNYYIKSRIINKRFNLNLN
jgi:hypothetical protein